MSVESAEAKVESTLHKQHKAADGREVNAGALLVFPQAGGALYTVLGRKKDDKVFGTFTGKETEFDVKVATELREIKEEEAHPAIDPALLSTFAQDTLSAKSKKLQSKGKPALSAEEIALYEQESTKVMQIFQANMTAGLFKKLAADAVQDLRFFNRQLEEAEQEIYTEEDVANALVAMFRELGEEAGWQVLERVLTYLKEGKMTIKLFGRQTLAAKLAEMKAAGQFPADVPIQTPTSMKEKGQWTTQFVLDGSGLLAEEGAALWEDIQNATPIPSEAQAQAAMLRAKTVPGRVSEFAQLSTVNLGAFSCHPIVFTDRVSQKKGLGAAFTTHGVAVQKTDAGQLIAEHITHTAFFGGTTAYYLGTLGVLVGASPDVKLGEMPQKVATEVGQFTAEQKEAAAREAAAKEALAGGAGSFKPADPGVAAAAPKPDADEAAKQLQGMQLSPIG
jgi:hypothetical protein